ncbi:MAG: replicative DNA helicase, partial [Chloroflexi bacterium]|nr:replicative DNA helicase [Chloroflexota bacterium]
MALDQAAVEPRAEPLPPHSVEAEEAVLGSVLVDRDAIGQVASFLRPEDFYRERNGSVYRAMLALYDHREPVDYLTVVDELERADKYEAVGGLAYLSSLLSVVPTSVHVEHYARIVERTAIMRRLIQAAGKIAQLGYQDSQDVDTVLERAEQLLLAVAQRRVTRDFQSLAEVLQEYLEQLEQVRHGERLKYGVPTGFIDLDKITGGLQRSDLIILAARPSLGKTSLALNVAANAALDARAKVAIFSLEMSKAQLAARLLSMQSGVDSTRLRTAHLSEVETRKLSHALGVLSEAPIYVDDTPSISIMELRSKARRLHLDLKLGLDLVVVDYLQLASSGNRDNRVQEISEISRSLKALARELHVPVLALSQLSRAVESRTPHIPMLSDLRESGCLTGDTPVYLPDAGTCRPMASLVGQQGFRVLALNTQTWQLEPRQVLKAFATGRKPVYRLMTRLGRSVRATANHRFLAAVGWRRLDELLDAAQASQQRAGGCSAGACPPPPGGAPPGWRATRGRGTSPRATAT